MKVIQIVIEPSLVGYKPGRLFALCDDGTIWSCVLDILGAYKWEQISEPPKIYSDQRKKMEEPK